MDSLELTDRTRILLFPGLTLPFGPALIVPCRLRECNKAAEAGRPGSTKIMAAHKIIAILLAAFLIFPAASLYFSTPYCVSSTGSSHSFDPFSPGTSMARCENQLSGAAPCQCFTPTGILMQSPGFISTAGLPHS